MTEFVLTDKSIGSEFANRVYNYANFLNQPLTLGMFVPCDEEGNVLEMPTQSEKNEFGGAFSTIEEQAELYCKMEQYQAAKERVLFKGFKIALVKSKNQPWYYIVDCIGFAWVTWNDSFTVEKLVKVNPTLTKSAIKQLGL